MDAENSNMQTPSEAEKDVNIQADDAPELL